MHADDQASLSPCWACSRSDALAWRPPAGAGVPQPGDDPAGRRQPRLRLAAEGRRDAVDAEDHGRRPGPGLGRLAAAGARQPARARSRSSTRPIPTPIPRACGFAMTSWTGSPPRTGCRSTSSRPPRRPPGRRRRARWPRASASLTTPTPRSTASSCRPWASATTALRAARRRSTLPAVHYWGIWNEPNIGSWMTPQWNTLKGGRKVEASPAIYRAMVDAAWRGLVATGHRHDTIMIGETAADGAGLRGYAGSMDPLTFIRAFYCVNTALQAADGRGRHPDRMSRVRQPRRVRPRPSGAVRLRGLGPSSLRVRAPAQLSTSRSQLGHAVWPLATGDSA